MPVYAGIDYSLTCPAVCVYNTDTGPLSFENTSVFFRSNLARFKAFRDGNLEGCNHGPWKDDIDRYDDISSWAIGILKHFKVGQVYLEGYSFGSTGRVFNIAENTAILKYNLWAKLTPRSTNVISPLNDIVDAYYILKYGIYNEKKK